MDMKIELILLPSKNLAESKDFYANKVGFHVDHDVEPGNGIHVIQLTPPGSACSIAIGTGMGTEESTPVKNIHLVVDDIDAARKQLIAKGIEVSDMLDMGGGVKYAYFSDPTGNTWALQELSR
ncbi:MAG TPA: VOC family protein [Candidatus Saccharimonadales bacterium]|nr:VOC family protein [Candidatus Saccharimonadales bacterium]